MVRTKEELLQSLRETLGDSTDDSSLSIIEDVSDTMDSFKDETDWKAEAERIDKEWRQKYHDRVFNPSPDKDVDPLDAGEPEPKKYRFEDLFTNY